MFVKICGITSEEDALLAVAMGADAVGFNFVPSSPRFLAVSRAADIANLGDAPRLDIDGNGQVDAATDGLLILRYMFGFRGDALIQNAVGQGAIRSTSGAIEAVLGPLLQ